MASYNFKINIKGLQVIPALIMMVLSTYFCLDFTVIDKQLLSYANLAFVLLGFCYTLLLVMRENSITRFSFLMIAFLIFITAISLMNSVDWKNWIYYSLSVVTLLLLFEYYRHNPIPLLIGTCIGLSISIALGSEDILMHPEKWINEENKDVAGYLLGGNYNQMGCRILLTLFINILCLRITKWAWIIFLPILILTFADLLVVQSMTAITCCILFIILCIIPNNRLQRFAIAGTLVFVILFEFFVCMQGKGLENNELATWFIVDVLGKDITFTYRTDMWDSALRVIAESPIWGHGYPTYEWYVSNMSSFAIGPHNMVLAVLIYGGILGLGMYISLYVIALVRLLKEKDKYANIIFAAVTMLTFMMLMEAYPIQIIMFLLLIAFHYCSIKSATD